LGAHDIALRSGLTDQAVNQRGTIRLIRNPNESPEQGSSSSQRRNPVNGRLVLDPGPAPDSPKLISIDSLPSKPSGGTDGVLSPPAGALRSSLTGSLRNPLGQGPALAPPFPLAAVNTPTPAHCPTSPSAAQASPLGPPPYVASLISTAKLPTSGCSSLVGSPGGYTPTAAHMDAPPSPFRMGGVGGGVAEPGGLGGVVDTEGTLYHMDNVNALRMQFDKLTCHRPPTPLGGGEDLNTALRHLSPSKRRASRFAGVGDQPFLLGGAPWIQAPLSPGMPTSSPPTSTGNSQEMLLLGSKSRPGSPSRMGPGSMSAPLSTGQQGSRDRRIPNAVQSPSRLRIQELPHPASHELSPGARRSLGLGLPEGQAPPLGSGLPGRSFRRESSSNSRLPEEAGRGSGGSQVGWPPGRGSGNGAAGEPAAPGACVAASLGRGGDDALSSFMHSYAGSGGPGSGGVAKP